MALSSINAYARGPCTHTSDPWAAEDTGDVNDGWPCTMRVRTRTCRRINEWPRTMRMDGGNELVVLARDLPSYEKYVRAVAFRFHVLVAVVHAEANGWYDLFCD
jgi:hypothetical protein